ncbi:methyltransferase family protein [Solidesulfovibrio fructosivorans]|nr:isoprenylcysteine carboxylmethyltransferase family protein [Solidesulfovibrio fructosivorans]
MTLILAGALMALPSDMLPGFGARFAPAGEGLFWIGIGLTALGLLFAAWARHCLGANWSGVVSIQSGHELVRTGPYALVRHPIYTGLLTAFAGSALTLGQWRGVAAVALAILALWRKLALEERWLIEEFGEPYKAYRRRVRAVIPFLL